METPGAGLYEGWVSETARGSISERFPARLLCLTGQAVVVCSVGRVELQGSFCCSHVWKHEGGRHISSRRRDSACSNRPLTTAEGGLVRIWSNTRPSPSDSLQGGVGPSLDSEGCFSDKGHGPGLRAKAAMGRAACGCRCWMRRPG